MECTKSITKQITITINISKFIQGNCDMCGSSPCVMVLKKSNITLEKSTQKKTTMSEICGSKLRIKCHKTFGLAYKHRFVVHSHKVQGSSNLLIVDGTYQSHIKKFSNDRTEKSKNN